MRYKMPYRVAAANPGADDVLSGREDIDKRSPVGKGSALLEDVAGTNGNSSRLASRGGIRRVAIPVTGCYLRA
jgi:hypothetical protein